MASSRNQAGEVGVTRGPLDVQVDQTLDRGLRVAPVVPEYVERTALVFLQSLDDA
jgi:hypothetical protein